MKKIYLLLVVFAVSMGMMSCSNDEDTTPSYADTERFAPDANDNSELAVFRRNFFERTGTYVLYNDTLRPNDVLKINYDMFSTGTSDSYDYTFEYINDFNTQKQAANLAEQKIVKRLGSLAPFSILLVDKINCWATYDGERYIKNNPSYFLGSQCYVISMDEGEALEDPSLLDGVIADIVYSKMKDKGDAFYADFFSLVDNYSELTDMWNDKTDLGYPYGYDDDLARSLGFLRDGSKWSFRSKSGDIQDYVKAAFSYTQSGFEEQFAGYPICIARFNKMKELIRSLGVVME